MGNCAGSSVAIGVHCGGVVGGEIVGGFGLSIEHFSGLLCNNDVSRDRGYGRGL